MLGLFADFTPSFVRRYAELGREVERAAEAYARDVRARRFPGPEHVYRVPSAGKDRAPAR
jgi:3-methyl-2-oxobutanoate hydroxymethyltransferase